MRSIFVALLLILLPAFVRAQATAGNLPKVTVAESPVPPGTIINMRNWTQYKQFMQTGLQALFSGKYFWKFPADFQMEIGQTHHFPLPTRFITDTERYSSLVKIVSLPNGGHQLSGYVAGLPFPNPAEPLRAWKLLVDMYYVYNVRLQCANDTFYLEDRFGNLHSESSREVGFRLSHVSDPGQPVNNPQGRGIYVSSYFLFTAPEQIHYTANLTLHYDDPAKPVDTFLFIPALRRSLRLSSGSRCSPFGGTDMLQDDAFRSNFNGNFEIFKGAFLRDGYDIIMMNADLKRLGNLDNYYRPVLFPKPSVGKEEIRPVWIIDVRRIPSRTKGYCYGKKIFYVDKDYYSAMWIDAYDSNMKLWKLMMVNQFERFVPHVGMTLTGQQWTDFIWDLESDHMTAGMATDAKGTPRGFNEQCRNFQGVNYDNISRYALSTGLSEILR